MKFLLFFLKSRPIMSALVLATVVGFGGWGATAWMSERNERRFEELQFALQQEVATYKDKLELMRLAKKMDEETIDAYAKSASKRILAAQKAELARKFAEEARRNAEEQRKIMEARWRRREEELNVNFNVWAETRVPEPIARSLYERAEIGGAPRCYEDCPYY